MRLKLLRTSFTIALFIAEQQQRIEAAKSVEEEVRELLAKYKASKPAEARTTSSAKGL